jgi:hypothetical protein
MYWLDALNAAKEICAKCGLLPMAMLEDNDIVLLVLSSTGKSCFLTTVLGGWPDGTRPHGDRPYCVPVQNGDKALQQFHLPLIGWEC